jgi:NAD-dependent dihydropyrimidine dehydrogenase PreA subunit
MSGVCHVDGSCPFACSEETREYIKSKFWSY